METMVIKKRNPPWQLILAWHIGFISLVNVVLIHTLPLEQIRFSFWRSMVSIIHIFYVAVMLNTVHREKITRRKIAWIFMSTSSLLLIFKLLFRSITLNNDLFIVIGVFVFTILGLVVYFPKSVWSLGNTGRVVCDILLLSFSLISLIQSGIYYFFGETDSARSAASYSIWVGFEIAGLISTVFLWHYYRQRILGLIVLAALCIVLADVTGTVRQWYPGVYRVSGLPDLSLNYMQLMIIMIFAYYSVDHFIEHPSYEKRTVSGFEWYYRLGVPLFVFIASVAMTLLVHPPDPWVTPVLLGVVLLQVVVSMRGGYRLVERLFQANAELQTAQNHLRQAMFNAEELAVQEERRRLSLEIHDGMGHHLTNAMRYLSLAADAIAQDLLKAKELFEVASAEVRKAHTDLRRSLQALTTNDIITQPLEVWLRGLVRECLYSGIAAELTVVGEPRMLPPNLQHALYRMAQEAVTNLQKYSQATQALISVTYTRSAVELVIQDDGVGIETPESAHGHGLKNMRARIEHLNGIFQILSGSGRGVTIRAYVPLALST